MANQSAAVVSGGSGNDGAGYYTLVGDDIKLMTAKSFTFEFQAKLPMLDYTNYTGNAGYLAFQDSANGSAPVWRQGRQRGRLDLRMYTRRLPQSMGRWHSMAHGIILHLFMTRSLTSCGLILTTT